MQANAEPVDLKRMPTGDSITHGIGSKSSGYRGYLFDLLFGGPRLHSIMMKPSLKVGPRNMVGSQSSGKHSADNDHEGVPGDHIHGVYVRTEQSVPLHRPNVVSLHAGTNDMNNSFNVTTAPGRLSKLIKKT